MDRGPPPGAQATVERLHDAWRSGDRSTVHALVDYRGRLAEVLGPVWASATEAERAAAVEMGRQMLEDTTEAHWERRFEGRPTVTRAVGAKGEARGVWIVVQAREDGASPFEWRYRLVDGEDGWRIRQREFEVNGMTSDTTRFYGMALGKIASDLGRTPTLGELNGRLPGLLGRVRTRRIEIPDLPQRRRPRAPEPR